LTRGEAAAKLFACFEKELRNRARKSFCTAEAGVANKQDIPSSATNPDI
jgi:hypothetical protein